MKPNRTIEHNVMLAGHYDCVIGDDPDRDSTYLAVLDLVLGVCWLI